MSPFQWKTSPDRGRTCDLLMQSMDVGGGGLVWPSAVRLSFNRSCVPRLADGYS